MPDRITRGNPHLQFPLIYSQIPGNVSVYVEIAKVGTAAQLKSIGAAIPTKCFRPRALILRDGLNMLRDDQKVDLPRLESSAEKT